MLTTSKSLSTECQLPRVYPERCAQLLSPFIAMFLYELSRFGRRLCQRSPVLEVFLVFHLLGWVTSFPCSIVFLPTSGILFLVYRFDSVFDAPKGLSQGLPALGLLFFPFFCNSSHSCLGRDGILVGIHCILIAPLSSMKLVQAYSLLLQLSSSLSICLSMYLALVFLTPSQILVPNVLQRCWLSY